MVHSRRVTVARARPRASRSRAKPSMSARRTANRFRDRARHHVVNWRRSRAYASRVRPRYPARNPARASRSASLKTGWIETSAVDGAAVDIGHLPAWAGAGKAGPVPAPAVKRKPTVSPAYLVTPCRQRRSDSAREAIRENTAYSVMHALPCWVPCCFFALAGYVDVLYPIFGD
jgi:hypothetical protein